MTWLRRIFRKKSIPPVDDPHKGGNQEMRPDIVSDAAYESTEELQKELQSGIYGSLEDDD